MRRKRIKVRETLSLLCIIVTIFVSCNHKNVNQEKVTQTNEADDMSEEDTACSCPRATILLVPYGSFTMKEAQTLKAELEPKLNDMVYGIWKIEVGKPQALEQSWYYAPRNRYRADRIIHSLNARTKGDTVRIALTHRDVSTSLHGQKDFGIMGLSYRPGRAAVVSTFRLKRHSDLWKVTLHEFLHSMGCHHCPNDDSHCIMQDAHGRNTFSQKNGLCKDCKERIG